MTIFTPVTYTSGVFVSEANLATACGYNIDVSNNKVLGLLS